MVLSNGQHHGDPPPVGEYDHEEYFDDHDPVDEEPPDEDDVDEQIEESGSEEEPEVSEPSVTLPARLGVYSTSVDTEGPLPTDSLPSPSESDPDHEDGSGASLVYSFDDSR